MTRSLLSAAILFALPSVPAWAHDNDHSSDQDTVPARAEQVPNALCPVTTDERPRILVTHRWLGTATAAMALATFVASERSWRQKAVRRRPYLVFLGITALLVGITGHFGGTLIHGTEHFTW